MRDQEVVVVGLGACLVVGVVRMTGGLDCDGVMQAAATGLPVTSQPTSQRQQSPFSGLLVAELPVVQHHQLHGLVECLCVPKRGMAMVFGIEFINS